MAYASLIAGPGVAARRPYEALELPDELDLFTLASYKSKKKG
jgi:hypothetical protein